MPGLESALQPLGMEDVIRGDFLPSLTGQEVFGDKVRNLLALPTRVGGLGIINPVHEAPYQYQASSTVAGLLVNLILSQTEDFPSEVVMELLEVRSELRHAKEK